MSAGALLFGAVATDRADSGVITAAKNVTTFTVLAIVARTGTLAANKSIYGNLADNVGNVSSTIQLRLSGVTGNIELRVTQVTTTLSFITNDTPFSGTGWKGIGATYDQAAGTRGHIYTGFPGGAVAENAYGTSNSGAGNKSTEGAIGSQLWGNRISAATNTDAWPGLIAIAAFFAVVLTAAEVASWIWCPRLTVNGKTAVDFKRFGKSGADGVDYAGNANATVTGATQADGAPVHIQTAMGGFTRRASGLYVQSHALTRAA